MHVAIALGSGKVALGVVAVSVHPGVLLSANRAGIPRLLPFAVALVLFIVVIRTRRCGIYFEAVAALWALGAGAFARSVLIGAGWPNPPTEVGFLVLVPLVILLAARRGPPRQVQVALLFPLFAFPAVGLALSVPASSSAAPAMDVVAYTTILILALGSLRLSTPFRRL